ncbi:hypothetical protein [Myxosarcina sp. GI1]|uniref:hypothetical protein n=1 Tax=Myxosarcina sp. GI1 TaxID=1541065 RepID=UPI0012E00398|nr:hypothetical protein [Myxosarcina sp. GI1]
MKTAVNVDVIGDVGITPNEVRLLEEFVEKKIGKRFTLILRVAQLEKISRDSVK